MMEEHVGLLKVFLVLFQGTPLSAHGGEVWKSWLRSRWARRLLCSGAWQVSCKSTLSPAHCCSLLLVVLSAVFVSIQLQSAMGIPTEVVGSLPRPMELQEAYAAYDAGKISKEDFVKAQDKAVQDSLKRMSKTGEVLITDGEQRASSFATYPITDTLNGTGLADGLAADGQYFAIFDDGHHRQLPRLVNGPFRYKTYQYENFKKSQPFAEGHELKTAVIAPSMLYLLYPLKEEIAGYTKDQFAEDLVNECEKDIRGCFTAGAKRVSIDFTEGRLTAKNDPRNPW
jgi:methionine synthase II (cobalamin-independent)